MREKHFQLAVLCDESRNEPPIFSVARDGAKVHGKVATYDHLKSLLGNWPSRPVDQPPVARIHDIEGDV